MNKKLLMTMAKKLWNYPKVKFSMEDPYNCAIPVCRELFDSDPCHFIENYNEWIKEVGISNKESRWLFSCNIVYDMTPRQISIRIRKFIKSDGIPENVQCDITASVF